MPVIAGLLAAGFTAWLISDLPRSRSLGLFDLVETSLVRALIVFLFCATSTYLVGTTIAGLDRRREAHLALKTSINGLWLLPLAIFLRMHSPWGMLGAAIFVAGVVRLLSSTADFPSPASDTPAAGLFRLLPSSGWSWQRASAIFAAFCAQTGALVGLGGYTLSSTLLASAGAAIWAISYPISPAQESQPLPTRPASRIAAITVLCTALALLPFLRISLRIPGYGTSPGKHALHGFSKVMPRPGADAPPSGDATTGSSGEHTGILLWAPEEKRTKLVAPPPVATANPLSHGRGIEPLIIPFDGVYWFFKTPDTSPPPSSRQAHGTPEQYEITSADWRPLSMEAHESLGTLIDLDCCSRIRIDIRNRDRFPDTVSLELVLIDTSLPGKPSQSLGSAIVKSTRAWHEDEKPSPINENLDFVIPANHTLHRFDQMMVRFRLDITRSDTGARMAIERFVLIPRGM